MTGSWSPLISTTVEKERESNRFVIKSFHRQPIKENRQWKARPKGLSQPRGVWGTCPPPLENLKLQVAKDTISCILGAKVLYLSTWWTYSSEALKCLNWLPLAGRCFSHRCTTVENAIKGDIPQHFESFKSTLRSSHGYNTRRGYLPRLPNPKTECGKRVSNFRFTNDWMSLPVFLRKPRPCTIFKKNLTRFLMDKHF